MAMPKESRKHRQALFNVLAVAIPVEQCIYGKTVPHVMHPGIPPGSTVFDSGGAADGYERGMQPTVADGLAPVADKESRDTDFTQKGVPTHGVSGKRFGCGRVNGHEAGLSKLGISNREQALRQIYVFVPELSSFAATKAGHGQ
jgi:hypothetical protein